ncbi:hypothetical protein SNE40_021946 [Patella caerulea]|uniref:Fibrinogen C-terminal domain-containing protein n=1 Tax=Patella caerulea TaxID=87958 RepID=A0AAN8GD20_PATCE
MISTLIQLLLTGTLITKSTSSTDTYSMFKKSNILQNPTDDDRDLRTTTGRGKYDCSAACGLDTDCRRFLYCSNSARCTLYRDGTDCIKKGDSAGCYCYKKTIGYKSGTVTCPLGYYGETCQNIFADCQEAYDSGLTIYGEQAAMTIQPSTSPNPFEVMCTIYSGGGKTAMLVRNSEWQYENFNRTWAEYEHGFGNVRLNHWVGLKNILAFSKNRPYQRIEFHVHKSDWSLCVTEYNYFRLGEQSDNYYFRVSYAGNAHCGFLDQAMVDQNNQFSTYDADYTGSNRCGQRFGGGWWFDDTLNCTTSFLTGTMDGSGVDNFWLDILAGEVLKKSTMFLQPF